MNDTMSVSTDKNEDIMIDDNKVVYVTREDFNALKAEVEVLKGRTKAKKSSKHGCYIDEFGIPSATRGKTLNSFKALGVSSDEKDVTKLVGISLFDICTTYGLIRIDENENKSYLQKVLDHPSLKGRWDIQLVNSKRYKTVKASDKKRVTDFYDKVVDNLEKGDTASTFTALQQIGHITGILNKGTKGKSNQ